MSDSPVKGAPSPVKGTRIGKVTGNDIGELIDVALADVGEWYSIPLPPDQSQGGIASTTAQQIGKRFAQISTKGGRLWIRIKPSS